MPKANHIHLVAEVVTNAASAKVVCADMLRTFTCCCSTVLFFFFFNKDLMLSSVDNFIWKTFILTRRKWWKSLTFKHSAVSVQRSNGNLKFWKPNVARNFLYRNGTKICDHDFYISHDCRSIIMSEFCAKPDFYYVQSAWIFIKTEYLSNDLPH